MLNHAADYNRRVMDARIKERRDITGAPDVTGLAEMPIHNGKRIDEMSSDELMGYMGNDGPKPKIIKTKN